MNTNTVVLYDNFHKKEIDNIFDADEATQRYYYYRTNIPRDEFSLRNYSGLIVYTTEDDEKISYSERTKAVYFNNKLYTRNHEIKGFTYNKKTGKIKMWFGGNLRSLKYMYLFYQHYKLEWVGQLDTNGIQLSNVMTPTLLGQIISKKITNPTQYIKKWLSTSLKLKIYSNISQVLKFLNVYPIGSIYDKVILLQRFKSYTINPVATLNRFISCLDKSNFGELMVNSTEDSKWINTFKDCLVQAEILNLKINGRWSLKRLNNEHFEMTKKIMVLDKSINNVSLNYKGPLSLPENSKLLSTGHDVASEGLFMQHCIYTNYWAVLKKYTYYAIHIDYKETPYTVGITYDRSLKKDKCFCIEQIQGKRNMEKIPTELVDLMNKWICDEDVQGFFAYNMSREWPLIHDTELSLASSKYANKYLQEKNELEEAV